MYTQIDSVGSLSRSTLRHRTQKLCAGFRTGFCRIQLRIGVSIFLVLLSLSLSSSLLQPTIATVQSRFHSCLCFSFKYQLLKHCVNYNSNTFFFYFILLRESSVQLKTMLNLGIRLESTRLLGQHGILHIFGVHHTYRLSHRRRREAQELRWTQELGWIDENVWI